LCNLLYNTASFKEVIFDIDFFDGIWEDVVFVKAVFVELLEDFDFLAG